VNKYVRILDTARENMNKQAVKRFVIGAVLIAAGMVTGAAITTTNEAHGEIRGTPPPQAFQSGGQLAVPVLKEIAATLHQIDGRLVRLEAMAKQMQAGKK
jgi:hypothetical protein